MRFIITTILIIGSLKVSSQTYDRPAPFYEASRALNSLEREQEIMDSLKGHYDGLWTLDFTYGQRFISTYNRSNFADTVTLTDFTANRSFFGVGTQHYITENFVMGLGVEFLFLQKKQEITSFYGTGGSGEGSGGLGISLNLSGKYLLTNWKYTQPYIGVAVGADRFMAKGGNVQFSLYSGREEELYTLTENFMSATVSTGISHRLSPKSLIDFNIGYAFTTKSSPIGGITSPGGLKASLTLQFILNLPKY